MMWKHLLELLLRLWKWGVQSLRLTQSSPADAQGEPASAWACLCVKGSRREKLEGSRCSHSLGILGSVEQYLYCFGLGYQNEKLWKVSNCYQGKPILFSLVCVKEKREEEAEESHSRTALAIQKQRVQHQSPSQSLLIQEPLLTLSLSLSLSLSGFLTTDLQDYSSVQWN